MSSPNRLPCSFSTHPPPDDLALKTLSPPKSLPPAHHPSNLTRVQCCKFRTHPCSNGGDWDPTHSYAYCVCSGRDYSAPSARGDLHPISARGDLHSTSARGDLHPTSARGDLHPTSARGDLHPPCDSIHYGFHSPPNCLGDRTTGCLETCSQDHPTSPTRRPFSRTEKDLIPPSVALGQFEVRLRQSITDKCPASQLLDRDSALMTTSYHDGSSGRLLLDEDAVTSPERGTNHVTFYGASSRLEAEIPAVQGGSTRVRFIVIRQMALVLVNRTKLRCRCSSGGGKWRGKRVSGVRNWREWWGRVRGGDGYWFMRVVLRWSCFQVWSALQQGLRLPC